MPAGKLVLCRRTRRLGHVVMSGAAWVDGSHTEVSVSLVERVLVVVTEARAHVPGSAPANKRSRIGEAEL